MVTLDGAPVSDGRWHEVRLERHDNGAKISLDGGDAEETARTPAAAPFAAGKWAGHRLSKHRAGQAEAAASVGAASWTVVVGGCIR